MKRTRLQQWAARFNQAPRQNFTYITAENHVRKYPNEMSLQTAQRLANLPERFCATCGQFYVWKIVMDKIPDNEMCFTCITGETDASGDYELMAQEAGNPQ